MTESMWVVKSSCPDPIHRVSTSMLNDVLNFSTLHIEFFLNIFNSPFIEINRPYLGSVCHALDEATLSKIEDISQDKRVVLCLKASTLYAIQQLHPAEYSSLLHFFGGVSTIQLELDFDASNVHELNNMFDAITVIQSPENYYLALLLNDIHRRDIYPLFEEQIDIILNFILRSDTSSMAQANNLPETCKSSSWFAAIKEALRTPLAKRFTPLKSTTKSAAKR